MKNKCAPRYSPVTHPPSPAAAPGARYGFLRGHAEQALSEQQAQAARHGWSGVRLLAV